MNNFALIFPGQGSQFVGMGLDFYNTFKMAKELYQQADKILGFKISSTSFSGPDVILNDTYNTQPAIFIASFVMYEVLKQRNGPDFIPICIAGHSLGEYTALVIGKALNFETGLLLVSERARLMSEAGAKSVGGMMAVIGATTDALNETIKKVVFETGSTLVIANDNCPGQVVISGSNLALENFSKIYKESGAKIVKKLPVSVACHSPLMESAQNKFDKMIDSININDTNVMICGNTTGKLIRNSNEISTELKTQLCKPVLWSDSIKTMITEGVKTFIEIGPGQILTGLIKRIDSNVNVINVGTIKDLEQSIFVTK